MSERASGLLLAITSLPSPYGIGDLGPAAYEFVDFLAQAGQAYWQVLPVNPPTVRSGFSPYQVSSAFAGNPMLISPDLLAEQALLGKKELGQAARIAPGLVHYRKAWAIKKKLLKMAYAHFQAGGCADAFECFCSENAAWLPDYAVFEAIRRRSRLPWDRWPSGLRDRTPRSMARVRADLATSIRQICFEQYIFFQQWQALRDYCHKKGVFIIGDLPFYLAHDSSEVWSNQGLFRLTRTGRPQLVSGVPPDRFSKTGQLWGSPVYDWAACHEEGYRLWLGRIGHNLRLFDLLRLDHFRGFAGFWAVKAGSRTAANGRWLKGPGKALLGDVFRLFPTERFIAEDLGTITEDVVELIEGFGLTSMRVLHFAFDGRPDTNPHYPHNHCRGCVVYTGTHDNNTSLGWYTQELDSQRRMELAGYLGHHIRPSDVPGEMIRLALASPAKIAVIPVQDLLCLGSEARLNRPGSSRGNWLWQLQEGQLDGTKADKLRSLTRLFGRCSVG